MDALMEWNVDIKLTTITVDIAQRMIRQSIR